MKIAHKYSHLNGEEYLIVHHHDLYEEIKTVIASINAEDFKTKISKEKTKKGNKLYSPINLNTAIDRSFQEIGWNESRYSYYITLDRELMEQSIPMSPGEQKKFLEENGEKAPIYFANKKNAISNVQRSCIL
ncbi:MAG TPA: hypothetical protein VFM82_07200 [Flavobacteriaceae bacterium]|nr:hypothetical protein [Flavobacteriaceae bacterium]